MVVSVQPMVTVVTSLKPDWVERLSQPMLTVNQATSYGNKQTWVLKNAAQ